MELLTCEKYERGNIEATGSLYLFLIFQITNIIYTYAIPLPL